jgi:hypothetical protein
MTMPDNLDCHCATCPNWHPEAWVKTFGSCDSVMGSHAADFGCVHHPNFTKLQAEVERLRQEIVALAVRSESCCVCAELRELEPSCEPTAKQPS